jgi:hypothetical protein
LQPPFEIDCTPIRPASHEFTRTAVHKIGRAAAARGVAVSLSIAPDLI